MDCIRTDANGQLTFTHSTEYLRIPSTLYGFHNDNTSTMTSKSGRTVFCFKGTLDLPEEERNCSCGYKMHINTSPEIKLQHLNFGSSLSCVVFPHIQLRCDKCGNTKSQHISFKADGHRITEDLLRYTCDLLASGTYTNKEVSEITGIGKNTVKEIDKNACKNYIPLMVVTALLSLTRRQNSLALMNSSFIMVASMPLIS